MRSKKLQRPSDIHFYDLQARNPDRWQQKKRQFLFCSLYTLGILLCSTSQHRLNAQTYKINKYGLKIIESLNTYQAAIVKNPDLELIPLDSLLPGLKTDFVYAGTHNFTGKVLYQAPRAYLRKPAALALQKVARAVQELGYGLLIYDAYRPYSVTVKMWEVVPDNRYAADPRHGSGHNRGLSVDLSLYDLKTGKPLKMPTGFDDFTIKAHQDYMELPDKVLENRSLLKKIMHAAGFKPLSTEWWHFSYPGENSEYHLMDISFALLNHQRKAP